MKIFVFNPGFILSDRRHESGLRTGPPGVLQLGGDNRISIGSGCSLAGHYGVSVPGGSEGALTGTGSFVL